MASAPIKNILAAVDLSSCSRAALEFACALADPLGAKVEVLFVHQRAGSGQSPDSELAAARSELHKFVSSVPSTAGLSLTERVDAGEAQERIVGIAESGGFDAVVLGTHGRTGRTRMLAGSVAESVVRTSSRPVITVRERS
jgi:nucleotide-binding universal stress UspA family protein